MNSILLVDDMKINIDMLTNILRSDYTVMAAINGESALKVINRRKPDLVLLDVTLPGIDGFGVLKQMKANAELANIPVIFVTGEHDACSEEKGLALGAVDYIKKPYNAAIVKAKVRNHLELKTYRDNLEMLVLERTKQLASSREAIIMGMSLLSEIHDCVTGAHIARIKAFTRILVTKIRQMYPSEMTQQTADEITLFSPLHDIGKVGISDAILNKTGILTSAEFDIMKSHTVSGANLLRQTEGFLSYRGKGEDLETAISIAESHHEKFDGTGYPHGLKGHEIPLAARIVTVADIYDALRSPRPYKKAFSHEESVKIIIKGDRRTCPEHFDPMVLSAFANSHEEFRLVEQN